MREQLLGLGADVEDHSALGIEDQRVFVFGDATEVVGIAEEERLESEARGDLHEMILFHVLETQRREQLLTEGIRVLIVVHLPLVKAILIQKVQKRLRDVVLVAYHLLLCLLLMMMSFVVVVVVVWKHLP